MHSSRLGRRSRGRISFHSVNPDDLTNEVTTVSSPGHGRAANLAPDRGIMTTTVGGSPIKGGKDHSASRGGLAAFPPNIPHLIGILGNPASKAWREEYLSLEGITLPRSEADMYSNRMMVACR